MPEEQSQSTAREQEHLKQAEEKAAGARTKTSLGEMLQSVQKNKQREHFVRAANEDDDGYDPWSDRPAKDPFWEEDPWR